MRLASHPLLGTLWIMVSVLEVILCVVVTRDPSKRIPRGFKTYTIVNVLWNIPVLICSAANSALWYSRIFWFGQYLSHAVVVVVATSCYYHLFWPLGKMPKEFYGRAKMAMPVVLGIAIFASVLAINGEKDYMTEMTTALDQAISIWICGMFWMLSIFSDWLGIPWHTRTYGVGLGFTICFTSALVTSSIRAHLSPAALHWHWSLWAVQFVVEAACIVIWLHYFTKPESCDMDAGPGSKQFLTMVKKEIVRSTTLMQLTVGQSGRTMNSPHHQRLPLL